jgi:hypothetical protein
MNENHNISSIRADKDTVARLQAFAKQYAKFGDSMRDAINLLLDDFYKRHQPKERNAKGQFTTKE